MILKFNIFKAFFIIIFRNKKDFHKTLKTKNDFEIILNYYLVNLWEMKINDNNIIIKNHLPFFKKRYEKMKDIINKHKVVGISIKYIN